MRQIKYRAKIMGSNSFVIGVPHNVYAEPSKELRRFDSIQYLDTNGMPCIEYIHSDTLQEFTGFTDKNGEDIYEGDILTEKVETDEGIIDAKYPVFYNNLIKIFCIDTSFHKDKSYWDEMDELDFTALEIAGNILEIPI